MITRVHKVVSQIINYLKIKKYAPKLAHVLLDVPLAILKQDKSVLAVRWDLSLSKIVVMNKNLALLDA